MPQTAANAVKKQAKPTQIYQSQAQAPTFGPTAGPSNGLIQRARKSPTSLSRQEVMQLQRTIGNQAVMRLLKPAPADPIAETVARTLAGPAAGRGVIQRDYEAAASPEAATLAANPELESKALGINKNTTVYTTAGGRTKATKDQLKNNDIVLKNNEIKSKGRSFYNVKIYLQKGVNKQAQNIEGYIKADHTKPFFAYQAQTNVPLLTPDTQPSPEHVKQGNIGDCYLMAAMMTVAKEDPQSIVSMFSPSPYDPRATAHSVRFFKMASGKGKATVPGEPVWVKVEKSVAAATFTADTWKAGQNYGGGGTQLWPAIIEKAYAAYKSQKLKDISSAGFIMGNITKVLTELSGKPQTMEEVGSDLEVSGIVQLPSEKKEEFTARKEREAKVIKKKQVLKTIGILKRGGMMFAGTGGTDKLKKPGQGGAPAAKGASGESKIEGLASGHAYAVLGLEKEGGMLYVKIRNPWGEYGRGKYKDGNYSVVEGEAGAISYIEIKDFLKQFGKMHHTLTETGVNTAIEELQNSDFLNDIDVGVNMEDDPPPPPPMEEDEDVPPPPPEEEEEAPPPPPED